MYKHIYRLIAIIILLVTVFHPERHAKYYKYIPKLDTLNELLEHRENYEHNLKNCVYDDLITNSFEISSYDIYKIHNFSQPTKGGEYKPKTCRPLYKIAVIVPYRDRPKQLDIFTNYMHSFLQKQNIHYRIFIVDQQDDQPFNRGKNLNIGAVEAMNAGFSCLILQDVDLIPVVSGNIYACTRQPRHMSSCVDTFRFQIPYVELFGGAIAMTSEDFVQINGYSNQYAGWGGEDDDLFRRLRANNLTMIRFSPELSRYLMLKHKKQKPAENRYNLLSKALQRLKTDGLNTLAVKYRVVQQPLYMHIIYT